MFGLRLPCHLRTKLFPLTTAGIGIALLAGCPADDPAGGPDDSAPASVRFFVHRTGFGGIAAFGGDVGVAGDICQAHRRGSQGKSQDIEGRRRRT